MFYIHLCSYKLMLLNDWSNPMSTMRVYLFKLQQPLINNNKLFYGVNKKYCFQKIYQLYWFSIFRCMGTSLLNLKKYIYSFPGGFSVENCGVVVVDIV